MSEAKVKYAYFKLDTVSSKLVVEAYKTLQKKPVEDYNNALDAFRKEYGFEFVVGDDHPSQPKLLGGGTSKREPKLVENKFMIPIEMEDGGTMWKPDKRSKEGKRMAQRIRNLRGLQSELTPFHRYTADILLGGQDFLLEFKDQKGIRRETAFLGGLCPTGEMVFQIPHFEGDSIQGVDVRLENIPKSEYIRLTEEFKQAPKLEVAK